MSFLLLFPTNDSSVAVKKNYLPVDSLTDTCVQFVPRK